MLGRHWKRWAAYLLAVIPFLFVLYFFYENVARLLPPEHLTSRPRHTIRRMPVDPAARQILDLIDQMGFKLGGDISPEELRAQMTAMEAMAPEMPEVASSEWQTIEGVPCQIIKPAGRQ